MPLYFINFQSAFLVAFPLFVAVALLSQGSWRFRFTLTRDLSIPVGIIGSLTGMQQIILLLDDGDAVGGATAVMLITIFYGGMLSAVGYFLLETGWVASDQRGQAPISFWRFAVVVTSFFLSLSVDIFSTEAFESFFNKGAALICGLVFVMALLVSSPGRRSTNLSRAFLFSSMVAVIVGLIMRFAGDRYGLFVAANGLLYGLVGYVIVYIWYAGRPEGEPINAPLTNWHWMEVTGFFIFMFLAPDTILDNFQEEAVQQQIQELQSEIAILRGDES